MEYPETVWSTANRFFLLQRRGIRVAALIFVVGVVLFFAGQLFQNRVVAAAARLPLKASVLEEAIGYGGMIHHFKNFLLRPEEGYDEKTLASARRAMATLDLLEEEIVGYGFDIDLSRSREAIRAYSDRVATVRRMHAEGATAREIDAVVRYDDARALAEVANLRAKIDEAISARLAFVRYLGLAMAMLALSGACGTLTIVLREHQGSLRAFREARAALGREQAGNDELRQFAYAVSHDLKAPMNTLHLLVSEVCVEAEGLSADQTELLGKALETIERAQEQVENLMRFAEMVETGEGPSETIDMNEKFKTVFDDLRADIERTGAIIELDHLPTIIGEKAQIRALCQNLIANAIKYSKVGQRPRIRVHSSTGTRQLFIHVTDKGIGIPADQTERVFEMFRRLHRQDQIAGTGLGLAVCRRVARNLGGELTVRSTLGEGSTFTLRLPIERKVTCTQRAA